MLAAVGRITGRRSAAGALEGEESRTTRMPRLEGRGLPVDDRPVDGADDSAQAADAVGVDDQVAEEDLHGLGPVAVRDEELHSRDVGRAEVDLADLAWLFGHFVEDLEAEVWPWRWNSSRIACPRAGNVWRTGAWPARGPGCRRD